MLSIVPAYSADNPLSITVLVDGNLIDFKDAEPRHAQELVNQLNSGIIPFRMKYIEE